MGPKFSASRVVDHLVDIMDHGADDSFHLSVSMKDCRTVANSTTSRLSGREVFHQCLRPLLPIIDSVDGG
jgi:hypothetical protein